MDDSPRGQQVSQLIERPRYGLVDLLGAAAAAEHEQLFLFAGAAARCRLRRQPREFGTRGRAGRKHPRAGRKPGACFVEGQTDHTGRRSQPTGCPAGDGVLFQEQQRNRQADRGAPGRRAGISTQPDHDRHVVVFQELASCAVTSQILRQKANGAGRPSRQRVTGQRQISKPGRLDKPPFKELSGAGKADRCRGVAES